MLAALPAVTATDADPGFVMGYRIVVEQASSGATQRGRRRASPLSHRRERRRPGDVT
jgi:hypothetical protein